MYKLFFERITLLNIFFIPLIKIFGVKIYYFELSLKLQTQKIVKLLEYFNIYWISFNKNENYIADKRFNCIEKSIKIAKKFSVIITNKVWNEKLNLFYGEKRYLQIYLYDHIKKNSYKYLLYLTLIKKKRKGSEKIFLWFENSFFSKIIIKLEKNFINLNSWFLGWVKIIPFFFKLLIFIFVKIISFIFYKLLEFFRIKKNIKIDNKNINNKLKTIVFPVGGLFKKSQTYFFDLTWIFTKKNKEKLNKNNFLFCELEANIKLSRKSQKFYKKIYPNFFIWRNISSNFLSISLIFNTLITYLSLFWKSDLRIANILILGALKIYIHKLKIRKFKNIENIIIFNELNFYKEILIAFKLEKKKIVCIQTRLQWPAAEFQFIIDEYLIIGNKTKKDLNKQIYKKINISKVGPLILKEKDSENQIRKNIYNKNCLVVDFAIKDWYEAGIHPIINWNVNLKFLKDIIKIAERNSNIQFTIKSKNFDWIKYDFFKPVIKEINKTNNLHIFNKNLILDNYQISKKFDFIIGKYTSMIDDFLSLNKPAIIYENFKFITPYIKYDKKIVANDVNDLDFKIKLLNKNFNKFNLDLNKMRNQFYSKFRIKTFYKYLRLRLNLPS